MTFRHHPDGLIYLDELTFSLSFWLAQEPEYTLPAGAISRYYSPLDRHTLSDGSSQWGGDLPWTEGDRYLDSKDRYTVALAAAQTPIPTPQDWDTFRARMLTDIDYQTLLVTVMSTPTNAWFGATMQQAISMPSPSVALVRPLWNKIISLAPPSPAAVQSWRKYAAEAPVPLVFAENGTLL